LGLLCKENSVATSWLANEWAFMNLMENVQQRRIRSGGNTRNFAQSSADQLLPGTNGRSGTEN
jgi:hypothetical protein